MMQYYSIKHKHTTKEGRLESVEWNAGMEHWNGIAKWFFLQNNITQLGLEYCHVNYKVFHC